MLAWGQAPTVQQEFAGGASFNKGHIVQLLEIIPDDMLGWKPNTDVRTISEVVAHIAAANYMFGGFLGAAPAVGVDAQSFEKTLKSKEDLLKAINDSFDYVTAASAAIKKNDLETEVELPFGKYTKRAIMSICNSHCSEHKGQFVTYARFIGVTPPWSGQM
ncbi:hypothetical protein BFP72_15560 [Reichenbachiella sp. 5M10]|nr:hypothetical protein BFP72_15560 [Reichenbachiella sp. 5M10]